MAHPGVQADVRVPAPLHTQQGHAVQSKGHHGREEEVLAHKMAEVSALAELDVIDAIDGALLVGLVVFQATPPDLIDRAGSHGVEEQGDQCASSWTPAVAGQQGCCEFSLTHNTVCHSQEALVLELEDLYMQSAVWGVALDGPGTHHSVPVSCIWISFTSH